MRWTLLLMLTTTLASAALADNLSVAAKDSAASVAALYKGKRITLRLRSGQELSGTVREATDKLVVLTELSGREFFDAAVPTEAIEAVIVRNRDGK